MISESSLGMYFVADGLYILYALPTNNIQIVSIE